MNLLQFWSAGYQIDELGMDIPNACKGSARRNAASNGKRNFHKRKNESKRFKKSIGRCLSARKQKQKKGIPRAHARGHPADLLDSRGSLGHARTLIGTGNRRSRFTQ